MLEFSDKVHYLEHTVRIKKFVQSDHDLIFNENSNQAKDFDKNVKKAFKEIVNSIKI